MQLWATVLMFATLIGGWPANAQDEWDRWNGWEEHVPGRLRIAICYHAVLDVAIQYQLRSSLSELLEGGCREETRIYKGDVYMLRPPPLRGFTAPLVDLVTTPILARMQENVLKIYDRRVAHECSGDGCLLKEYGGCLVAESLRSLDKRVRPRAFEIEAEGGACLEYKARSLNAMRHDFDNALKGQLAGGLTKAVRVAINNVLDDARKQAVIAYAEDLERAVPGSLRCKLQDCERGCAFREADADYICAISE